MWLQCPLLWCLCFSKGPIAPLRSVMWLMWTLNALATVACQLGNLPTSATPGDILACVVMVMLLINMKLILLPAGYLLWNKIIPFHFGMSISILNTYSCLHHQTRNIGLPLFRPLVIMLHGTFQSISIQCYLYSALQSPGPRLPWSKHNADRGKEKLPVNWKKP